MREAVHVLGLNAATQCDPKKVGNWSCTACNSSMYDLQDINVTENGGHMAFTAFDRSLPGPGKIRVVLRGSLSVRDWISDANFFIDKAYSELGCEGCGVERGFHDSYQDLRPGIEASVEALLAKEAEEREKRMEENRKCEEEERKKWEAEKAERNAETLGMLWGCSGVL